MTSPHAVSEALYVSTFVFILVMLSTTDELFGLFNILLPAIITTNISADKQPKNIFPLLFNFVFLLFLFLHPFS